MTRILLFSAMLLMLASCRKKTEFEEFVAIPDAWNNSNLVHFNVNITDTVTPQNVYISVRHSGKYEFSNLYLFVTAESPNGNIKRDTVEMVMADEHGKWQGKGAASVFTLYYPYKTNIRFPAAGIYTFTIEQAMWIRDLKNISNIGLMIEKAGKSK
jgi:gliding motility-associated lipoprotein GldH